MGIEDRLARRNRRVFWLLAMLAMPLEILAMVGVSILILFIFEVFSGVLVSDHDAVSTFLNVYSVTILSLFLSWFFITWSRHHVKNSIEDVLAKNQAYVVKQSKEYKILLDILSELTVAYNIEMPEVYVILTDKNKDSKNTKPKANLLFLQRNDRFALIVTDALLTYLDRYELEGILAAELELVKCQYIKYVTLTEIIYAPIYLVGSLFAIIGGLGFVVYLMQSILHHFQSRLLINFKAADVRTVSITYNPEALISGLKKMKLASSEPPRSKVKFGGDLIYSGAWMYPLNDIFFTPEKLFNFQISHLKNIDQEDLRKNGFDTVMKKDTHRIDIKG